MCLIFQLIFTAFDLKPKKSFGQHFLRREDIARRIAGSLSHTDQYQTVLEVGPGKGMLTRFLLDRAFQLSVVEADRDMVGYLQGHFPELEGRIFFEDFLQFDPHVHFGEDQIGLVGNFPYNISSQIVFRMLKYRTSYPEMVGMFQKEMAQRIIAPPGSKTYGVISVLTQAYYTGEYLFTVDRSAFDPPPKVQSGVIRLVRKPDPRLECDEALFTRIVKTAFGQRRKMLRNTLKPFFPPGTEAILQQDLFTRRPEALSLGEFIELTTRIEELNP